MSASLEIPSTNNIGVIGACWYLRPKDFVKKSDRFLARAMGAAKIEKYYVAMKPQSPGCEELLDGAGLTWCVGNGKFLDISAYAQACEAMPKNLPLYLIFNDTLFDKHPWRLVSHRLSLLRDSLMAYSGAAVSGEVHSSTDLLLIDPYNQSRRHISTFCLLLNNKAFHVFSRVLCDLPKSNDPDFIKRWIKSMVVSYPALKALLHVHLLGPRSPWTWSNNCDHLIDRKAVTVIFEYLFTVELLRVGVCLPINCGFVYRLRSRLGQFG